MRVLERTSSDDGATKILLGLDDGSRIECVFLVMDDKGKDSLCISSQVGCPLSCRFCRTGKIGFARNLTADEIVGQTTTALTDLGFSVRRRFDLSYMGMGEPLYNLDAVIESKDRIRDKIGQWLSCHLSTVGIVPHIYELAQRSPDFVLQISLHAPNDALRTQIIPSNRAYPLADLLRAAEAYAAACGRTVVFNYCLMRNLNDDARFAHEVVSLVQDRPFEVQIVDLNQDTAIPYQRTEPARRDEFIEILANAGVVYHYTYQRGSLRGAGCGQLDADYKEKSLRRAAE